jgi:large subunit ribosomal protein L10
MAKTKLQKNEMLEEYKKLLDEHPNYIVVDLTGTTMAEITEIKDALDKSGSTFHALKNTLFKIAAQDKNQPNQIQEISGSSAVVALGEDPTAPAKAIVEAQKKFEKMAVKLGVLFGEITDAEKINQLALIPSREVLLARLVGSMQSPISGFMSVARGNVREFIIALSEIQKTK